MNKEIGARIKVTNPCYEWGMTKVGSVGTIDMMGSINCGVQFDNQNHWWIDDKDYELIEDTKFKIGDRVIYTGSHVPLQGTEGMILRVDLSTAQIKWANNTVSTESPEDYRAVESGPKFKVGDMVRIVAQDTPVDNLVLGKFGEINRISNSDTYWVLLNVPGYESSSWYFSDWQLDLVTINKEDNNMSVVNEVADLDLSENEQLLRKHGLKNECGKPTNEGVAVLNELLFKENEDKIVELLKKLEKKQKDCECKDKKSK